MSELMPRDVRCRRRSPVVWTIPLGRPVVPGENRITAGGRNRRQRNRCGQVFGVWSRRTVVGPGQVADVRVTSTIVHSLSAAEGAARRQRPTVVPAPTELVRRSTRSGPYGRSGDRSTIARTPKSGAAGRQIAPDRRRGKQRRRRSRDVRHERGDPVPRTDSEAAQRRRQSGNLRDECRATDPPRRLILTHRNQTRPPIGARLSTSRA